MVACTSSRPIQHYKAYHPKPFTSADKARVTVLYSWGTRKYDRLFQGVLENLGFRAQPLPETVRADLEAGKELIDAGACCPALFITGNLINFLRARVAEEGRQAVMDGYAFLTIGGCGPCRFGQYRESYTLALESVGLRDFRVLLADQYHLKTKGEKDQGLSTTLGFGLGFLWVGYCCDLLDDLEYATRPYEVTPGETDRVLQESVELLYEAFRRRPVQHSEWTTLAWYLTTQYFKRVLREVYAKWRAIEVDRLRVKPKVKITGEMWLHHHEGEGNYHIKRWLEQEGAEVVPSQVVIYPDYLIHYNMEEIKQRQHVIRHPQLRIGVGRLMSWLLHHKYDSLRRCLGNLPRRLPEQGELARLAAPFYFYRLNGGEGHMLVGKALHAYHQRLAHMICELSPYACVPNAMSVGAMANVLGKYPALLYAPIEVKGDAEVHALSRCQMILTEAKKRATHELDEVLARTGLTLARIREYEANHPAIRMVGNRIPGLGATGTAANYALYVARSLGLPLPQATGPVPAAEGHA